MNNKWTRAAIPALLLHVSIGTVYCWSTFKVSIAEHIGASVGQVEWAFSLAIFFLGISAAALGKIVEKNIKASSLIATIFFTCGMLGTALSIHLKSLIGIYLSYGVTMGIGLGVGYLTPVKNLMLWFDKNKGLATGLAVAGFGLAKVIASPVMEILINRTSLSGMFAILGCVYFVMMLGGHLLIKRPAGYVASAASDGKDKKDSLILGLLKNPVFIGIWLMFYLNITCGLALISQEKDLLMVILTAMGKDPVAISSIVAVILSVSAAFNAMGRLGFSSLSDKFKYRETSYAILLLISFVVTFAVIITNAISGNLLWLVVIMLFLVNAGYGGGFSTLPVLLHQNFGMKNISAIHGLSLFAWAFAGLSGNQLASLIVNTLGMSYSVVIIVICVLYAVSLGICLLIRANSKKIAKLDLIPKS